LESGNTEMKNPEVIATEFLPSEKYLRQNFAVNPSI